MTKKFTKKLLTILFSVAMLISFGLFATFTLSSGTAYADSGITEDDFTILMSVRVPDEDYPTGGMRFKVRIKKDKFESALTDGEKIKSGVSTGILITSNAIAKTLDGGLIRENALGQENGVYDHDTTDLWRLMEGTDYYESKLFIYNVPEGSGGVKLVVRPYVITSSGANPVYRKNVDGASIADVVLNDHSLPEDVRATFEEKYLTFAVTYFDKAESEIYTNSHVYGDTISAAETEAPSVTGYTFDAWKNKSGTKAFVFGETVITDNVNLYAKYNANTYTVKFNANGGTGSMDDLSATYDEEKVLTNNAFTRVGYTFTGWAKTSGGSKVYNNGATVKNLSSTDGATVDLYAKWSPNTDTAYTVKYYLQNLDDNGYTLDRTDNLTGTTGATANANILVYDHFNYNSSQSTVSGTIAADGSLVLSVYYDRETYDISITSNSCVTKFTGAGTYKYGQTIDIRAWLKVGYDYLDWYLDGKLIGGGEYEEEDNIRVSKLIADTTLDSTQKLLSPALTLSVVAYPCTATEYNVKYYYMNTSGSYPSAANPTRIETLSGITDETVSITPVEETGFTFNPLKSKISGTIAGDGSLELTVYFARVQYNVALGRETDNGTVSGGGNKYYGASVTVTATPDTAKGYSFAGWYEGLTLISEDANYTFTVERAITLNARWKFDGGGVIASCSTQDAWWSCYNAFNALYGAGEYGVKVDYQIIQNAESSAEQYTYLAFGKDQNVLMSDSPVESGYFCVQLIIQGSANNNNIFMNLYDHNKQALGETNKYVGSLTVGTPFDLSLSFVLTNNGTWYFIAETAYTTYIDGLNFNSNVGSSFMHDYASRDYSMNLGMYNAVSAKATINLCAVTQQTKMYKVIPEDAIGGVTNSDNCRTSWTYSDIKGSLVQAGAYGITYEFGARLAGTPNSIQYAYISFGQDGVVLQPTTDGSGAQSAGHFMLKLMVNPEGDYPRMFMSLIGSNGKVDDILGGLQDVSIGALASDVYTKFRIGFIQGGNGIWYMSFLYNGEIILDGVAIGDNVFNNNVGSAFKNASNQTNFSIINPKDTKIDLMCFGYETQDVQYSVLPSGVVGGIGQGNTRTTWSYYDENGSLYQAGVYGVKYEFGLRLDSAANGETIQLSFGQDGTVYTKGSTATEGHFIIELTVTSGNEITMKYIDHNGKKPYPVTVTIYQMESEMIAAGYFYRFTLGYVKGTDGAWYLTLSNIYWDTQDGQYFAASTGGAFMNDNNKTNVAIVMGSEVPATIVLFRAEAQIVPYSVADGAEGVFGYTEQKETNTFSGINFASVKSFSSQEDLTAFEDMVVNSDGSVNNSAQDTAIMRSVYYETKVDRNNVYEWIDSYTIATARKIGGDETKTTKPHTIVYLDVDENRIESGVRLQIKNNSGSITSAKILPETFTGTDIAINNEYVYFTVNRYGAYTLIIDDSYEKPLTVFVRKPEHVVVPDGYTVIKYTPTQVSIKPADSDEYSVITDGSKGTLIEEGKWEIGTELISYGTYDAFGSKTIIYIEKGTILVPSSTMGATFGALIGAANRGTTDIKIMGHGIIDMSRLPKTVEVDDPDNPGKTKTVSTAIVTIYMNHVTNFEMNGITILNGPSWTVDIEACENVHIEDVIIFGYRLNSDGICINSCTNAVVKNCFARSGDDLFEIKTSSDESKHVLFEGCIAWADKCRAFGIIQETMRDISDVTYKDCYLLFQLYAWLGRSEPDESVPVTDTYMAAMVVVAGEKASVYDVTFDNCIINSCFAYAVHISVGQNDETWTDEDRVSPDNFQNYAKNIVFKNCRIQNLTNEDYTPMRDTSQNPKYFRYYNNTDDPGAITVTFDGFKINDSNIVSESIMKDYTVYHANANEGIYDYITVK